MINEDDSDNANTPVSNSCKQATSPACSREVNRVNGAAVRSQTIRREILITLAEWHRVDHLAERPTLIAGAASPPALQREGRFSAPAMPNDVAVAVDATHVPGWGGTTPTRHKPTAPPRRTP
ncbi:hypothetical protein [Curtobacterium sp. PhB136]|uniref:hypothetical protein n=1 Tax=Curtobacterium sp. PhB136 TaxID=2485181 RepID=UPI00104776BB|nr:hypothetical protein [Curtobacterium sp. PhB136]TCK59266.1 hypothetical protein EDF27_3788 [Curtobacterium sp. PhB136]